MSPVALGSRASGVPVPAGRPGKHACGSAGGIAFPAEGNWINMSGGIAQLGPFNLPYRYWLVAVANNIYAETTAWVRYDVQLILFNGTVYLADLNGQQFHQNADSHEPSANWCGQSIQTAFYCEANLPYYVRWLTKNSPAGVSYYQHPSHTNFMAYTVGEGIY